MCGWLSIGWHMADNNLTFLTLQLPDFKFCLTKIGDPH